MKRERLTDASIGKLTKRVQKLVNQAGLAVIIGVPPGVHRSGLSYAELAMIHEYGAGNVPERAHFRKSMVENRKKYRRLLAKAAELKVKRNSQRGYDALALVAANDVKNTIRNGLEPALADSTIAAKGSSKPLIDTGAYIQSIDAEVVKG